MYHSWPIGTISPVPFCHSWTVVQRDFQNNLVQLIAVIVLFCSILSRSFDIEKQSCSCLARRQKCLQGRIYFCKVVRPLCGPLAITPDNVEDNIRSEDYLAESEFLDKAEYGVLRLPYFATKGKENPKCTTSKARRSPRHSAHGSGNQLNGTPYWLVLGWGYFMLSVAILPIVLRSIILRIAAIRGTIPNYISLSWMFSKWQFNDTLFFIIDAAPK